ncbi:MAG: hypothetical protein GY953_30265, partial [bacterium]|nr:hypothetical protein [bacterium]
GALAGYFGGKVDDLIVWIYTTLACVPGLLLILAIAWAIGGGLKAIYIALGATTWVQLCRLIRGEFLTALAPGTQEAFRFGSLDADSVYHHQVNGVYREGSGYRTVYLGFPLYHLATASAQSLLQSAMTYFGELGSTGAANLGAHPAAFALAQNRPNPFGSDTKIVFAVPGGQTGVELAIYDIGGRRVRTLLSGLLSGGVYSEV